MEQFEITSTVEVSSDAGGIILHSVLLVSYNSFCNGLANYQAV